MTRYAEDTKVSVEKSEAELKQLLRRHGAARIATGFDDRLGLAVVNFETSGRFVRLQIAVPTEEALRLEAEAEPPHGWKGWNSAKRRDWLRRRREQIERQRWRALVLVTKAKLELVAEGLSSLEREFLADLVLPGGQTVHQALAAPLATAYETGKLPPLLPGM